MINPEIPKPDRASRSNDVWTSASRNRLKILKAWRAEIADDLDLAVSHVWPTPSLERLSLHPETFNDELHDSREIRQWQREEFAAQLTQVVQSTQWQLLGRAQPDD
jgi:ribonuclease D